MNTNPENSKDWTIPTELPPAFELPQQFRQSLSPDVQQWLASVEKRIDGLTLERIRNEAEELCDAHGTDIVETSTGPRDLYRLGRRIFYTRCQQIVDIMFPDQGVEFGVDLLWGQVVNMLPGAAVSDAVTDGENINGNCLINLKAAGFAVEPWD